MGVWAQSVAYRTLEEIQAWHVNPLSNHLFFLLLTYGNLKQKKNQKESLLAMNTSLLLKDKTGRKIYKSQSFIKQGQPDSCSLTHHLGMTRSSSAKHTILVHWDQ